jgi:hypothetical protein
MYYLKNLYLQRLFVSKENVLEPVKANSLNFIHKGKLLNLKYLFVLCVCARSKFYLFFSVSANLTWLRLLLLHFSCRLPAPSPPSLPPSELHAATHNRRFLTNYSQNNKNHITRKSFT